MTNHSTIILGTLGGTILSITAIPNTTTIISTIILAIIGTSVSFFTTVGIKYLWNKYIKKK